MQQALEVNWVENALLSVSSPRRSRRTPTTGRCWRARSPHAAQRDRRDQAGARPGRTRRRHRRGDGRDEAVAFSEGMENLHEDELTTALFNRRWGERLAHPGGRTRLRAPGSSQNSRPSAPRLKIVVSPARVRVSPSETGAVSALGSRHHREGELGRARDYADTVVRRLRGAGGDGFLRLAGCWRGRHSSVRAQPLLRIRVLLLRQEEQ